MKIQKWDKKIDRFIICDDEGKIIDDAQGWGYKTVEKARKAMWYKFKGGKQKRKKEEKERKKFFNQHPEIKKYIKSLYEINFKELARGEVTENDLIEEIEKKFEINIPKSFLKNILD